jgi:hypothetical protein
VRFLKILWGKSLGYRANLMKIFGVRFAEKRKPSDEEQEQEQEQERGISVMFEDFLSKRQKMYSTNTHSTKTNRFIKHHRNVI